MATGLEDLGAIPIKSSPDVTNASGTGLEDLGAVPIAKETNKPGILSEAFSNVIPSAGNALKGITSAVTSPIQTGKTVAKLALGAALKVNPAMILASKISPTMAAVKSSQEETFNNFTDLLKQRYGSMDAVQETIRKDPVGFIMDASALLSGAGGALGKLGKVSEIGSLAKAGKIASTVGEFTDPVTLAAKAAGLGARVAGETLGLTTGAGGAAIKEAFMRRNPEAFTEAMRGGVPGEEILHTAKDALQEIKDTRANSYRATLEKILPQQVTLDIAPIKKLLYDKVQQFGVKFAEDGSLDFSRSTVSAKGAADVEEAINTVADWGSQAGDNTPLGFDKLKRKLDDLIPATGEGRAFVAPLKSEVRKSLIQNVPGYQKLVGDYEKYSNLIKDLTQTLSLSDKSMVDTGIRKLTSVMRQNNEFRNAMVQKLGEFGGEKLLPQIAGNALSPWMPRGLQGVIAGANVGASISHPSFLLGLPLASPRLVGEFVNALGLPVQKANVLLNAIGKQRVMNALKGTERVGFQTNRITRSQEQ